MAEDKVCEPSHITRKWDENWNPLCEPDCPCKKAKPRCVGKAGLYFNKHHQQIPCSGRRWFMKDFWLWTPDGNLDAVICAEHRHIFGCYNMPRSYLSERIREAVQAD